MMFYTIEPACDTPETGSVYPQVQDMVAGYDFTKPNSIHKLRYNKLPDFQPDLDYFVLEKKAKPTDLISVSISPFGFLIGEKFKSILEKFTLPEHEFYPATLAVGDSKLDSYFWFLPIYNLSDQVDYSKTIFYSKDTFNNVEKLDINSPEDVKEQWPKIGYTKKIVSENIYFKSGFKLNLDLFMIGVFDFNIYLSEGLKSTLINEKITGLDLRPVEYLVTQKAAMQI